MRPDTYETICACIGGFALVCMIVLLGWWAGWL
jgi:hypothetical protein